ncbi:hypothetical protein [Paraburkholderia sediminicola]|uniref:hypothetical protein n=1 Tax=Paraburkholderia sediminicola TaxID=458836 RepID=UPI0038BA629E
MDDDLIELRFGLYDDRFEHCERRIKELEDARDEKAEANESRLGRQMNWAMLSLFVIEVVIGGVEIWMMFRHA